MSKCPLSPVVEVKMLDGEGGTIITFNIFEEFSFCLLILVLFFFHPHTCQCHCPLSPVVELKKRNCEPSSPPRFLMKFPFWLFFVLRGCCRCLGVEDVNMMNFLFSCLLLFFFILRGVNVEVSLVTSCRVEDGQRWMQSADNRWLSAAAQMKNDKQKGALVNWGPRGV